MARRIAAILAAVSLAACLSPSPDLVLWAWERPEDLRFLEPGEAEVAVLLVTLRLEGDRVDIRPRRVPLRVDDGVRVLGVARIESAPNDRPTLSDRQFERCRRTLLSFARDERLSGFQVDFDAVRSERDFYRRLLDSLRPGIKRLSMTALASWCVGDRWISDLSVDEAVPMLFRMGPGGDEVLRTLEREGGFPEPLCRGALGVSTDEPLRWRPEAPRLYVFHPTAWTPDAYRDFRSSLD